MGASTGGGQHGWGPARVGASTGGGHREARVRAIALAGIKVSVQAGRKGGC